MAAGADEPGEGKGRKRKGGRPKKGKPRGNGGGPSGKRKGRSSAKGKGLGKGGSPGGKLSAEERAQGQRRAAMIRAIDHPLRRRILRTFQDDDDARSPGQIARALDTPLSSVSYQVTVLRRLVALRSAGSVPVRGAIEHFYQSTIKNDLPIELLLEETRKLDEEDARRGRKR